MPGQYNIETFRTAGRFGRGHAALGDGEVPRGIEKRELLDSESRILTQLYRELLCDVAPLARNSAWRTDHLFV